MFVAHGKHLVLDLFEAFLGAYGSLRRGVEVLLNGILKPGSILLRQAAID
jgi:hypothetical protein